jgi:hypothetical protein
MIRRWCAWLAFACAGLLGAQEAQKAAPGALTIEEVLQLCKTGVAYELVIDIVKRNGRAFDLNADEIVVLKNSGVSETVIKYLVDPSLPYTPAVSPPAASNHPPALTKPPSDPLALKVPPDSGIFYLSGKDEFRALDLKPVLPSKKRGKVPSMLSGGLLKGHVVGSVIGPNAKTRAAHGPGTFYARLGEKSAIDDFALLNLRRSDSRRDLDFGSKADKPVFPVASLIQFESREVSPGLFRLQVALKNPGEYLFFILGSGDEKKGLLGKGYEFGVD